MKQAQLTKNSLKILLVVITLVLAGLFIFLKSRSENVEKNEFRPIIGDATLMIGDSQSVRGLGSAVALSLAKNSISEKNKFYLYAISGSRFSDWVDGSVYKLKESFFFIQPNRTDKRGSSLETAEMHMKLKDLVESIRPKILILSFGINEFVNSHQPDDPNDVKSKAVIFATRSQLKDLLIRHPKMQCFWFGPTLITKSKYLDSEQNRFFNELKYAVSATGCQYVDSRIIVDIDFTSNQKPASIERCYVQGAPPLKPDSADGIHISGQKLNYWSECLIKQMENRTR